MKNAFAILIMLLCFYSLGQKTKKPIQNEQLNFHSQVYFKTNEATLYFSIASLHLLKKKNSVTDLFERRFKVEITIGNNKNEPISKEYSHIATSNLMNLIVDSFPIGLKPTAFDYEITVTDLNKNQFNYVEKEVDPSKEFGACYFLKRDAKGVPVLSNYFSSENIFLHSSKYKNQSVRCYQFDNNIIAPPPFIQLSGSVNLGSADSIYQIGFNANGVSEINLKEALLILSNDRLNLDDNYFLYQVTELYPYFKTYTELILPLKYITSRDEFTLLKNSTNQKERFEKFWIELAGSKEIAKELIKEFYGRVKFANSHFSSFKPGWKTDRGIMHIIFGEPEIIDVSGKEIQWTYSNKFEARSSTFTFYLSLSNISNDFELVRNPLFKSGWYIAMETWRNGQVYQR